MPNNTIGSRVYLDMVGPHTEHAACFKKIMADTSRFLKLKEPITISLQFLNRPAMARLNAAYRKKQGPTDTITFALEQSPEFIRPPKLDIRILGDMYLCLPQIRENARKAGIPFDEELHYVFVHGLLHLLGYDHETDKGYQQMTGLMEKILFPHDGRS
ncbi:rRNA maturation RNase YbeY [Candidatus Wirthbacteria bacterium CG2_30_54_11]|uniref:Endoribonuclease YbeY n=1 Tax=Candidatus Wirthbacteria bacterium CG2_30_54_11 TaxID=1817892 RepID=A0A1J5ID00_9BACT|nr:MAG: rRNA maturation RNase YbeY [Candidatus Wirthbacteria bacterium CG2_30_54_11]